MAHLHGGDTEGYLRRFGRAPLDFSANVSPLGLPAGVRRAVITSLSRADAYPDPRCRVLREAIAGHEGTAPERVICGNGAADLVFRLAAALRPGAALLPAPTFAEYEQALRAQGCEIRRFSLLPEEGFRITGRLLEAVTPSVDVLFLCQPNNPTGQLCPRPLLLELLERCRVCGVTLVMDECFVDFLEEPEAFSLRDRLEDYDNLFILKAFTKLYAMAGLRLGYGLSKNAGLLRAMGEAGQPWSVSSVAQAAGVAALKETGYVDRVKRLLARERPFLKRGLQAAGVDCLGGEANYIFFRSPEPQLHARLWEEGVMIRDCANYAGLAPGYYRVAVRGREDNRRLIRSVAHIIRR